MNFNKRYKLTLLFWLIANLAIANNYYFSSVSGNDSYTRQKAQNPLMPWKSLEKFNSIISDVKPGDSILFKRGEVYVGTLVIKNSGTALSHIVIGAYGIGPSPIITGLKVLKSWSYVRAGVYQSQCHECNLKENLLIINGVNEPIGRFPNIGYFVYQEHLANNLIICKSLGSTDWQGAEIVIRKNHWIIDKMKIIVQGADRISYAAGTSDLPTDGFGCFVQNAPGTLDKFGEWYFDPVKKNMQVFFGTKNPSTLAIKTSIVNNLVIVDNSCFITFKNITFEGANESTFKIQNSQYISIRNCSLNSSGADAVIASSVPHLEIENTTFNHALNDAISLDEFCSFASIRNNFIKNTGLFPGMGSNGTGGYTGIMSFGSNSLIEFNELDSTGYDGIYFGGDKTIVKNNLIKNFCLVKDDGAGIYVGDWKPWKGKLIAGNIILNGLGATQGTDSPPFAMAEGIYVDDNSGELQISSNTVSNCADAGIKIHNAHNVLIKDNVLFGNLTQLILSNDRITPIPVRNIIFSNNIVFPKSKSQLSVDFQSIAKNIEDWGRSDSNYYAIPETGVHTFHANISGNNWSSLTYDLNGWKALLKMEEHSHGFQVKYDARVNLNNYILFECNPTKLPKLISLNRPCIDLKNNIYKGNITLKPYSSILLMIAKPGS
jgi:parallel beta-helix repeat protein